MQLLSTWARSHSGRGRLDRSMPTTRICPLPVGSPLEWFSIAVTPRQLSRESSLTIHHRPIAQFGDTITAEPVVPTDEQRLRDAGLSHQQARTIRSPALTTRDFLCPAARVTESSIWTL